ncbi:hypothetical protein [Streptomyces bohaiensis]|uniref:Uncharacterized protein n=1 Tax=Streptomyces bohaiensis TaxID=1431344 RepID=A0ABX1CDV4_9ACTN|nr:hypothetical protein [Streptomyces bohaiensis]NJQ15567.1 hypothetical protein [Streptomyces bohaiensis]
MFTDPRHERRASAEEANAAIRALVTAQGGRAWSADDLAELGRLRAEWLAAVRAQVTTAA